MDIVSKEFNSSQASVGMYGMAKMLLVFKYSCTTAVYEMLSASVKAVSGLTNMLYKI